MILPTAAFFMDVITEMAFMKPRIEQGDVAEVIELNRRPVLAD